MICFCWLVVSTREQRRFAITSSWLSALGTAGSARSREPGASRQQAAASSHRRNGRKADRQCAGASARGASSLRARAAAPWPDVGLPEDHRHRQHRAVRVTDRHHRRRLRLPRIGQFCRSGSAADPEDPGEPAGAGGVDRQRPDRHLAAAARDHQRPAHRQFAGCGESRFRDRAAGGDHRRRGVVLGTQRHRQPRRHPRPAPQFRDLSRGLEARAQLPALESRAEEPLRDGPPHHRPPLCHERHDGLPRPSSRHRRDSGEPGLGDRRRGERQRIRRRRQQPAHDRAHPGLRSVRRRPARRLPLHARCAGAQVHRPARPWHRSLCGGEGRAAQRGHLHPERALECGVGSRPRDLPGQPRPAGQFHCRLRSARKRRRVLAHRGMGVAEDRSGRLRPDRGEGTARRQRRPHHRRREHRQIRRRHDLRALRPAAVLRAVSDVGGPPLQRRLAREALHRLGHQGQRSAGRSHGAACLSLEQGQDPRGCRAWERHAFADDDGVLQCEVPDSARRIGGLRSRERRGQVQPGVVDDGGNGRRTSPVRCASRTFTRIWPCAFTAAISPSSTAWDSTSRGLQGRTSTSFSG